jgi:hypothetical protein
MTVQQLKFHPGKIFVTPTIHEWLSEHAGMVSARSAWLTTCLTRHMAGDWGDLDEEDRAANDLALGRGTRLLSAYESVRHRRRLWIITEADRSATTMLWPEDY